MTTTERSLRFLHAGCLAGRASFDDVKRATDDAVTAFEASRGRQPTQKIEPTSPSR